MIEIIIQLIILIVGFLFLIKGADYFVEGSSDIQIERTILNMSNPDAKVELDEYMVGCYGTTEYSEDMSSLQLGCIKGNDKATIDYAYKCREEEMEQADSVFAVVPPIDTQVYMKAKGASYTGYVKEGQAFSPMFTLGYKTTLGEKEVFTTWLKVEKAD